MLEMKQLDDGRWMAVRDFGGTPVWGEGDTPETARIDYAFALVEAYDHLAKNYDRLAPRLQQQYKAIDAYFEHQS